MELVIPPRNMDFDFNRSSPAYLSTPSTPKRFGDFYLGSAPTSPTRMSEFYREFDDFLINTANGPPAEIPFEWEEKPGTPKSPKDKDDFAFDFRAESEKASLSADELFDGGKIRPLKPPPRSQLGGIDGNPKSPRSSVAQGKKIVREAFSPRRKKDLDLDPFVTAVENTRKRSEHERGRDRTPALSSSTSGRRKGTRSVSPLRVSDFPWEDKKQLSQLPPVSKPSLPSVDASSSTISSSSKSSRKWRLRDFLLFRSASEGRAADKDPFSKYAAFKKQEDVNNASFRSTDGSVSGSTSKRRGPVSAHELHYTMNKAISEDLKKKTFLPYKQGILGRLAFNPSVSAIANGFGSFTRS